MITGRETHLKQSIDKHVLVVNFAGITLYAQDVASHVRQNKGAKMITSCTLVLITGFILRYQLLAKNTERDLGVQVDMRGESFLHRSNFISLV